MTTEDLLQGSAAPSHQSSGVEQVTKTSTDQAADLAADLLVGAEAIARALNWRTTSGSWNKRRVYHLAGKGRFPFHKVPGLGLVCRKTALDSYFKSLDERFLRSLDADSPTS